VNVRFIGPMESLAVKKLPTGDKWTYEVKLDGFRAVAVPFPPKSMLTLILIAIVRRVFSYVSTTAFSE